MTGLSLANKRVLVVGGSSGIGLAVAEMAAGRGAEVTIAARDEARLAEAAGVVGHRCAAQRIDTADEAGIAAFFEGQAPFDHVVVTAAKPGGGLTADLPMETALALFDSKFWGSYRVARAAKITPGGSLTLVSGVAGRRPRPARVVVGAACAALESMTRGLALELAPVRVNCVSPGVTDTPLLRSAFPAGTPLPGQATPVGRVGRAEEIALQILACAENGFMTGAVIDVDGGMGAA